MQMTSLVLIQKELFIYSTFRQKHLKLIKIENTRNKSEDLQIFYFFMGLMIKQVFVGEIIFISLYS